MPSRFTCLLPPARCACRGFTFVETLVALALAALILALSVPAIHRMVQHYRVQAVAQALLADYGSARAEAIRHGASMVLSITPVRTCLPSPSALQQRCGWTVFQDLDGNRRADQGEPVLHRYELPQGVDLEDIHQEIVQFGPGGETRPRTSRVVVAPAGRRGDGATSQILCLNFTGRVRVKAGDTCPD